MEVAIKFLGFWPTFDINNNVFVDALKQKHDIRVLQATDPDKPDLLFYSWYSRGEHLEYDCIKIYFTGENDFPDFNQCDYALSFYNLEYNDRHLRYPLFKLYEYDQLNSPFPISDNDAVSRPFCSLLMRNHSNCDPKRLQIINAVENYKPIVYGGPFRNNTGGCVTEKIPFIHKFKFNLALENSIVDGYVTEKILEPFVAATIPVYWGDESVRHDFNPDAFINANDFDDTDGLINFIRKVDNDTNLYLQMLRAPKLIADKVVDFDSRLADFLDRIVTERKSHLQPFGSINVIKERYKLMWTMMNNPVLRKSTRLNHKLHKSRR